jgi:hypothetical protein
MLNESDPEAEKEVKEMMGDDYGAEFDETEFKKHENLLDLPDSESEGDDLEQDMKGEETDSDLEDYYRELGIADEEDFSKKKDKNEELY